MSAFYQATEELGLAGDVTTFTHTEFNRTLIPNAKLGSEHAWGGHQLVMGGGAAVAKSTAHFPRSRLMAPTMWAAGFSFLPRLSVQYCRRWAGGMAFRSRNYRRCCPKSAAFGLRICRLLN